MKQMVGRMILAAMAISMLAGCGSDRDDTDDFTLNGSYTVVMSGSEGGEPFESEGVMFLSTSGTMVTGEWRFDGAPVSVISGTVSGQISGNDFDFALMPEIPVTNCGTVFVGRAIVRTTTQFSGFYGGGCIGQEVTASFVAKVELR